MLYRPGLLGRMPCPSEWYAGSGNPTIDENFATAIPSGWTFSRSSANATNCLYTDSATAPALVTYASNAPRFLPFGLLMEPQRTNLFLNSEAPTAGSQTINVVAGDYCCWMLGTGSVTLAAGTAVGTNFGAVTVGTFRRITITQAGTITATVAGTVTRAQFEAGSSPTSYIQSSGVASTRTEDRLSKNYLGGELNVNEGTYWVEWCAANPVSVAGLTQLLTAGIGSYASNANTDQIVIYAPATNVASGFVFDGASATKAQSSLIFPRAYGAVSRTALSVSLHRCMIAQDYALDVNAPQDPGFRPPTLLAITLGGGGLTAPFNGYIRAFKYWPVAMGDAELKECTGAGYYASRPVFDLDGTNSSHWRPWLITRSASSAAVHTDGVMSDPAGTTVTQFGSGLIPPGLPRWTARGLMLDTTRSNMLPNSDALAASGVTGSLNTQSWMLTVRGSGSVTITPNTCVGTGFPATATQGSPAVVAISTAGTANFTRTGTVELAQLEQAGTPTPATGSDGGPSSFIKSTTAGQTRNAEGISTDIGPWWNQAQGMYLIEFMMTSRISGTYIWGVDDGTANNREQVFAANGATGLQTWGSNTIYRGYNPGRVDPDVSQHPMSTNVWHRMVVAVSSDRKRQIAMDGVLGQTGLVRAGGDDGLIPRLTATKMKIGMNFSGNIPPSMIVRRWRYYDYAIFDEALRALSVVGTE